MKTISLAPLKSQLSRINLALGVGLLTLLILSIILTGHGMHKYRTACQLLSSSYFDLLKVLYLIASYTLIPPKYYIKTFISCLVMVNACSEPIWCLF